MAEDSARVPATVDHKRWFQKLEATLSELRPHIKAGGIALLERLARELQDFKQVLSHQPKPDVVDISEVRGEALPPKGGEGEWKMLGKGAFGIVFRVTFQGNPSAVKIFKASMDSRVKESDILRGLSHDNIIAYRGTGMVTSKSLRERIGEDMVKLKDDDEEGMEDENLVYRFLIMEFLPKNLETFVQMYVSEKSEMKQRGLPDEQTCVIGEKMANALAYLHSKNIAHRDLKPDNVLIDPARRTVKLADFGLAWHQDARMLLDRRTGSVTSSVKHVRWSAPELMQTSAEQSKGDRQKRYEQGDIWSLAMILVYCITRKKPFDDFAFSGDIDSSSITPERTPLPSDLPPDLRSVVEGCRDIDPLRRPSASSVASTLLKLHGGLEVTEYEFFTCGFLKKTEIFVADSCVAEDSVGCLALGTRGEGYSHKYLLCPVDTNPANFYPTPEDWDLEDSYIKALHRLQDDAHKKIIDDNPAVALKELTVARPGKDELQLLELKYQQTTYCHHRAMREMWMKELSDADRRREVTCLATVHPFFSTSFGLHLAVLTNEGPDKDKKFIFCRRAQRPGMSSPGAITCGAVESCSVNDFEGSEGDRRVNLVRTAARGLHEELGVELQGRDLEAVTLQTVYLKYDTHEWGMCGYVDLSDDRIDPSRRLSAEQLISRFTIGPKDKFEHQRVIPVDFTLDKMVDFVFENQDTFASSAKLVVVKVLQTFFGVEPVQRKFQMYSAN